MGLEADEADKRNIAFFPEFYYIFEPESDKWMQWICLSILLHLTSILKDFAQEARFILFCWLHQNWPIY